MSQSQRMIAMKRSEKQIEEIEEKIRCAEALNLSHVDALKEELYIAKTLLYSGYSVLPPISLDIKSILIALLILIIASM
jgi:hypothetical protein